MGVYQRVATRFSCSGSDYDNPVMKRDVEVRITVSKRQWWSFDPPSGNRECTVDNGMLPLTSCYAVTMLTKWANRIIRNISTVYVPTPTSKSTATSIATSLTMPSAFRTTTNIVSTTMTTPDTVTGTFTPNAAATITSSTFVWTACTPNNFADNVRGRIRENAMPLYSKATANLRTGRVLEANSAYFCCMAALESSRTPRILVFTTLVGRYLSIYRFIFKERCTDPVTPRMLRNYTSHGVDYQLDVMGIEAALFYKV